MNFYFLKKKQRAVKNLDKIIQHFNNWSHPWTFKDYVINHDTIKKEECEYFLKAWKTAMEFEDWNHPDLAKGCEVTMKKLRKKFDFDEKSIKQIVNAVSYEWK
jgi:deoxyadenosine/deoxycytidine kinase